VCLTWDVETRDSIERIELPFVVGVLADLSGMRREPLPGLRDRSFVPIDRDSFNTVLDQAAPRLLLQVPDRLSATGATQSVELVFHHLDDFGPIRLVPQLPPLAELLDARRRLFRVLATGERKDGGPHPAAARAETEAALALARGLLVGSEAPTGPNLLGDAESDLRRGLAAFDRELSAQLGKVLHHPAFQRLEATWRGLHYLVQRPPSGASLRIRVLNISKSELLRELSEAAGPCQSPLHEKVYEEGFGVVCGNPYGLLVGDYEFSREPGDVHLLRMISNVAAAAHCPFVAAASPRMFDLTRFTELAVPRDLSGVFQGTEYEAWNSFRDSADARFAVLTLPHVLGRLPYGPDSPAVGDLRFEEFADGEDHDKYLWMSAAWAYAARVTDAFAKDGWFARTYGVEGGGKVQDLPVHNFPADDGDIAMKCPMEIAISKRREFELSSLGFLALLYDVHRDAAAFSGSHSCQRPRQYFDPAAQLNAELSARFNYLLCASRFAHYLKVMARDKIGSFMEVGDCQRWLNDWISNYVATGPDSAGDEFLARCPLAEARVELHEITGKPGCHEVVVWVRPYFQFRALTTSMQLVGEVPRARRPLAGCLDPSWLRWHEGTVVGIARAIRRDLRFRDLSILADALEEAGCVDKALLAHCRSPHDGRGCWVLDAVLGSAQPGGA
jgi:type VI secretion system protein ImpC